MQGVIVKIESKDYFVLSPANKIIRCSLRGKFKKDLLYKKDKLLTLDHAAIGDRVEIKLYQHDTGVIHKIEKRKNYLSRKAVRTKGALKRGERLEQVIASNLDNLFIISSIKKPKFNNKFLDRVIVAAESSKINVIIVINKIDLDKKELYKKWEQLYTDIGYNVIITSAATNFGISEVQEKLKNKVNIFWGQSGAGKSTILNKMFPDLNFKVGKVSEFSNKGVHTTVSAEMRKVDDKTFIIDTPGIREIDPYGIKKADLGHYFREFVPFLHGCKFSTCTHSHEPGCEVFRAFEENGISNYRYESYLNMLDTIEEGMIY